MNLVILVTIIVNGESNVSRVHGDSGKYGGFVDGKTGHSDYSDEFDDSCEFWDSGDSCEFGGFGVSGKSGSWACTNMLLFPVQETNMRPFFLLEFLLFHLLQDQFQFQLVF